VVRSLADWAFGSADDPKYGVCWTALVNGLTSKDGPSFSLEPLPVSASAPAPADTAPNPSHTTKLPIMTYLDWRVVQVHYLNTRELMCTLVEEKRKFNGEVVAESRSRRRFTLDELEKLRESLKLVQVRGDDE